MGCNRPAYSTSAGRGCSSPEPRLDKDSSNIRAAGHGHRHRRRVRRRTDVGHGPIGGAGGHRSITTRHIRQATAPPKTHLHRHATGCDATRRRAAPVTRQVAPANRGERVVGPAGNSGRVMPVEAPGVNSAREQSERTKAKQAQCQDIPFHGDPVSGEVRRTMKGIVVMLVLSPEHSSSNGQRKSSKWSTNAKGRTGHALAICKWRK